MGRYWYFLGVGMPGSEIDTRSFGSGMSVIDGPLMARIPQQEAVSRQFIRPTGRRYVFDPEFLE